MDKRNIYNTWSYINKREIIEGIFYEKELQKVFKEDEYYKYDKILKTRIKNGKKQYFVSWLKKVSFQNDLWGK